MWMILLNSNLENVETVYAIANKQLNTYQFSLGGSWDYEHGYFDRSLDGVDKVWLRIPFEVTKGALDGEKEDLETEIRLGKPFVLKHIFNEGLDPEADFMTYGGLLDQFQDPIDKDAEIEQKWIDQGQQLLKQIEKDLLN
jgi:hypothetical protein